MNRSCHKPQHLGPPEEMVHNSSLSKELPECSGLISSFHSQANYRFVSVVRVLLLERYIWQEPHGAEGVSGVAHSEGR